jgi:hypothetical protein
MMSVIPERERQASESGINFSKRSSDSIDSGIALKRAPE